MSGNAGLVADLVQQMEDAAAALDFEAARRLRDRIALIRAGGPDATSDFDPAGLVRQQPGAMGIGTSRQQVTPPEGWVKPGKPDPMTANRSRRGRR